MSTPNTEVASAPLDHAFAALRTYAAGSPRGALLPIDQAVFACAGNHSELEKFEQRLINELSLCSSDVGREYLLSKLALVGSATCLKAVSALALRPGTATAARHVLEQVPSPKADKALLALISKSEGKLKVGLLNSVGARRGDQSVKSLRRWLRDKDPVVRAVVLAALGRIGSEAAARALLSYGCPSEDAVASAFYAAALECASSCARQQRTLQARALYTLLANSSAPAHIRRAAEVGLRSV